MVKKKPKLFVSQIWKPLRQHFGVFEDIGDSMFLRLGVALPFKLLVDRFSPHPNKIGSYATRA